jgi:hypothetical protein
MKRCVVVVAAARARKAAASTPVHTRTVIGRTKRYIPIEGL